MAHRLSQQVLGSNSASIDICQQLQHALIQPRRAPNQINIRGEHNISIPQSRGQKSSSSVTRQPMLSDERRKILLIIGAARVGVSTANLRIRFANVYLRFVGFSEQAYHEQANTRAILEIARHKLYFAAHIRLSDKRCVHIGSGSSKSGSKDGCW